MLFVCGHKDLIGQLHQYTVLFGLEVLKWFKTHTLTKSYEHIFQCRPDNVSLLYSPLPSDENLHF